jgi:hypothetical protein
MPNFKIAVENDYRDTKRIEYFMGKKQYVLEEFLCKILRFFRPSSGLTLSGDMR